MSPTLFVVGIALALAAVHQTQQTVRSQRATSARLIRDYGAFAAWSFRQHVGETLRAMLRETFTAAVHARPDGAPAGAMSAAEWHAGLREAQAADSGDGPCGEECLPPYYFRVVVDRPDQAAFAGDVPAAGTRAAVVAAVTAHAASPASPDGDFAMVRAPIDGRERLIAYAVVWTPAGRKVAYGYEFQPERYGALYEGVFAAEELLPRVVTGARANAALLGIRVQRPGGRVVFSSSDTTAWAQRSSEAMDDQLGGLVVGAAMLQSAVGPLTGSALGRSRLPLVAGLLVLSCALAGVAVYQMRRDAELARLRADFVSSVSHELRTPLAQVQLFLETLRLGRHRTDEQREWIFENMQREMTRLTALVDNVLHFSRAGRGIMGGVREPTALAAYLESIVADFAPLAAVRGVSLLTQVEPGLVAPLHRESFRQATLNLLDNAVKYGPPGQAVTISAALAGDRVRLDVEDEGPGVDPRERTTIFEPYRRGERAIGSVAVGSGIGLSVVREVVAWHEGTIHVEGGPRGGARFVIDLPGWREAAAAPAPASTSASDTAPDAPPRATTGVAG